MEFQLGLPYTAHIIKPSTQFTPFNIDRGQIHLNLRFVLSDKRNMQWQRTFSGYFFLFLFLLQLNEKNTHYFSNLNTVNYFL